VVPVVDLRLRFDMEAIDYTDRTCIIVVEIAGQSRAMMTDYILGMAKIVGG
jgi:purine-binding chemotaxis protein CheW